MKKTARTLTADGIRRGLKMAGMWCFVIAAAVAVAGNRQRSDGCGGPRRYFENQGNRARNGRAGPVAYAQIY